MSLGQYVEGATGTFVALATFHGVMECEEWQQPLQALAVPGLIGSTHLLDYRKSRTISIEARHHGYASYAALSTAMEALDALNQALTGTVVLSGSLVAEHANCTFMGFKRGTPRFDGSGNNGWWIEGRFHWIQRSPT